jgi:hypothetical protein
MKIKMIILFAFVFIIGTFFGIFIGFKFKPNWTGIQMNEVLDLKYEITELQLLRQNDIDKAIKLIESHSSFRIAGICPPMLFHDNEVEIIGKETLLLLDNYKNKYSYSSGDHFTDSMINCGIIWARSK